jgi:hypothetical protein
MKVFQELAYDHNPSGDYDLMIGDPDNPTPKKCNIGDLPFIPLSGGVADFANDLSIGIHNSDAATYNSINLKKDTISIGTNDTTDWSTVRFIDMNENGILMYDREEDIVFHAFGDSNNVRIYTDYGKVYYNDNEIATVNQIAALETRIAALESA